MQPPSTPAAPSTTPIGLEVVSQMLLFFLLAGMAGTCDTHLFFQQLRKFHGIVAALLCHYTVMPLIAFATVKMIPQPDVTAITLLVICTSPSGGFSGFWCSLWNADLALSVAVTTASTLASCLVLPLNLYLYCEVFYGHHVALDWTQIAISIGVVVGGAWRERKQNPCFWHDVFTLHCQTHSPCGTPVSVACPFCHTASPLTRQRSPPACSCRITTLARADPSTRRVLWPAWRSCLSRRLQTRHPTIRSTAISRGNDGGWGVVLYRGGGEGLLIEPAAATSPLPHPCPCAALEESTQLVRRLLPTSLCRPRDYIWPLSSSPTGGARSYHHRHRVRCGHARCRASPTQPARAFQLLVPRLTHRPLARLAALISLPSSCPSPPIINPAAVITQVCLPEYRTSTLCRSLRVPSRSSWCCRRSAPRLRGG